MDPAGDYAEPSYDVAYGPDLTTLTRPSASVEGMRADIRYGAALDLI